MSEDGQIDLPIGAGGTKLYKHRLVDSDDMGIAILSTSNTPITQENFMTELTHALQGIVEISNDGTSWELPRTAEGITHTWGIAYNTNLLVGDGFGSGFPIASDDVSEF